MGASLSILPVGQDRALTWVLPSAAGAGGPVSFRPDGLVSAVVPVSAHEVIDGINYATGTVGREGLQG